MGKKFTAVTIMQAAAVAIGNGTEIITQGLASLGLQVTGTFVATITWEGNIDGTNWVALPACNLATNVVSTIATAAGIYFINVAGLQALRARISAWTSGTITVVGLASEIPMGGVKPPMENYDTAPQTGELQGSLTALQMPDIPCRMVMFKASYDNVGKVYIGSSASVTVANGVTDITTGIQLSPGDQTPWLPAPNLNLYWRICTVAGDDLTYMAMG